MTITSKIAQACVLSALVAAPFTPTALAQQAEGDVMATVVGTPPADLSGMVEGPEIEGIITARKGERLQVTTEDGSKTVVRIADATEIKAKKGFLGLGRSELTSSSLLNGLPVKVKTVEWGGGLLASRVRVSGDDLKTATMIRNGTAQGFAEQTAATDALRSRVGDIDEYNIMGTTNVYFDTGRYSLTPEAEADLCATANAANSTDNALLLVVGYTDSTGSYEVNQRLSEQRASRVVNYLQQACGWKPYRMLTPTGMAASDPAASNDSAYGKAQNRRVAVNILVSKALDGI
jgi:outer membrane protein OmpA-like peptidoglycan-associated protein